MAISWLSMVYMLVYIPMIVPSTWILNHYGLRVSLLIGAALNAFGAWIKCLSMELSQLPSAPATTSSASSFPVLMIGQLVCATAQSFTLGAPAQLASTWFATSEVALATSIGVFGNQVSVFKITKAFVLKLAAAWNNNKQICCGSEFTLIRHLTCAQQVSLSRH